MTPHIKAEIGSSICSPSKQPGLKVLRKARDPVGPENDCFIVDAARSADCVIAAWGNHGVLLDRDRRVLDLLEASHQLWCFGVNKNGSPKHPLYLSYDVRPQRLCLNP